MSVGGGVTILAGRDVSQFSASLPTTVRVSGGISPLDPTEVAHVTGGGDLLVRAGRDIVSGHYYVGKGEGDLQAGGSFRAGWAASTSSASCCAAVPVKVRCTVGPVGIEGVTWTVASTDVTMPRTSSEFFDDTNMVITSARTATPELMGTTRTE